MAKNLFDRESSRRDFMRRGLCGIGVTAALPMFLRQSSTALAMQALGAGKEKYPNRIMVVLELSGYDFRAALQSNRAMADHVIKVLASRLRQLEDEFAPRIRS